MIVASLVLAVFPCAAADVVTLTAVLEENGAPLDRQVSAAFVLWDAPTVGGTAVWSDDARPITVVDGVLTVEIGAARPLPQRVFAAPTWLEVIVDGEPLEPRVRITSAPHALEAAHAMSADTCASLDGLSADDVVTKDALAVPVFARVAACGGGIDVAETCLTTLCRFTTEPQYLDCAGVCTSSETPAVCTLNPIGWLARL
jgi:hypothetical protein